MTDTFASVSTSATATMETMELLQPKVRSRSRVVSGYIDVLGKGEERTGTHLNQRVFRSKVVPPIYEHFWRPIVAKYLFGRKLNFSKELRIVLDELDLSPADRLLDVGCGPGNYARQLAEIVTDGLVVGIDASTAMVAAAVRRGLRPNLAYVRGDGGELPFQDAQFDAVCCVGVIHLIDEPMTALEEMVRMLAPGGRLAIGATWEERPESTVRAGITVFGNNTLTAALSEQGLTQVEQRIAGHGQFVSARKVG